MAKTKNPSIRVNWDSGEGVFDVGASLENENPLFKVDVLGDIKRQAQSAYDKAYDELYPGQRGREQRAANFRRRVTAATLIGQTVKKVEPLRNGDVALELSDGRVLVLCAERADVHLRSADSIDQAVNYANQQCRHDWFVAEPTKKDSELESTTYKNQLLSSSMGIVAP